MQENHIDIRKSARYYTLGALNDNTSEVWFILHGYAQLAKDILQKFEELNNDNIYFIAPEGLNKFYSRGFAGNPVASWMSSEDRMNEIKDYCNYLDQLFLYFELDKKPNIKINVLGFSQGVTTASRWIVSNDFSFHHFVLYAGEIAKEFQEELPSKLGNIPSTIVRGRNDSLIKEERIKSIIDLYKNTPHQYIEFEGGHEVTSEMAEMILKSRTIKIVT
jgi:predicted esterase